MAEAQTQQEPELRTDGDGGIVGFYAEATASKDYQAEKFGIEYRYGTPVGYIDAIQQFAEIQGQALEQANAQLSNRLAENQAAKAKAAPAPAQQPAKQQQPPKPPPPTEEPTEASAEAAVVEHAGGQLVEGQPAGGLPVQVGTSPKGQQVRYVPSSALPSKAFEDVIREQIAGLGFDPDDFAVFDNRVTREGAKFAGLEDGGQNYSVASVLARKDTAASQMIEKAAFYVDFNEDGTVKVKASPAAQAYLKAQAAFGGGQ